MLRLTQSPRSLRSNRPLLRRIWTLRTLQSSSAEALVNYLKDHSSSSSSSSTPAATFFALTKNVPFEILSPIYAILSDQGKRDCIGSLTELLPSYPTSSSTSSPSPSTTIPTTPTRDIYAISIASYVPPNSSQRIIPFLSTLKGRPPISLGREILPSKWERADQSDTAFEDFLQGKGMKFGSEESGDHKGGNRRVEGLEAIPPENVKELIYFTSDRSQPWLNLLSNSYTRTAKLGLLASSTPFHSPTGAQFTLISHDGQLHSSGAVGFAIVSDDVDSNNRKPVELDYGDLKALPGKDGTGEQGFEVTSSQGNIVLTLSSQNAARLLLDAVNDLNKSTNSSTTSSNQGRFGRSEEKEKEFYGAVFNSKPTLPLDLSASSFVTKIMAGDPSRGAMSFDTERRVKEGDWVVFLHRDSSPTTPSLSKKTEFESEGAGFEFHSVPSSDHTPSSTPTSSSSTPVTTIKDKFIAASENGIVVSSTRKEGAKADEGESGGNDWVCSIDGVRIRLPVDR